MAIVVRPGQRRDQTREIRVVGGRLGALTEAQLTQPSLSTILTPVAPVPGGWSWAPLGAYVPADWSVSMAEVQIPLADGIADAYLAVPSGGVGPGVLLWIDAIGLRPQIKQMADRIAGWGYVVLAPNVFYRAGDAPSLVPTADLRIQANREAFLPQIKARVAGLTTELFASDLPGYVAALSEHGLAPFGVTGYCMGARLALRTAGAYPELFTAVGGFHGGGLVTAAPDSPHLELPRSTAEYVFGHAANDHGMTLEDVDALGKALAEAGLEAKNEVYDAGHGYTMTDTAPYDEAAAERAFTELEALFSRRLGA
jgi:carboxymethylenebutenolidase